MKNFIVAAFVMVSSAAYAETWVAPTEANGEIILTKRECKLRGRPEPKLLEMYVAKAGGEVVHGCWAVFDNKVQVIYEDDYSRWSYDPQLFTKHESY